MRKRRRDRRGRARPQRDGADRRVRQPTRSRALADHDFVSEYRLVVFPVMLARGRRLLGASPDKLRLDLVDRQRFGRFRAGRPIEV
jgi:hypothetical protein